MQKKISVIIPTFNEASTGLLHNILLRLTSFEELEIIVVDRNSTDGTNDIINFFPVIKLIKTDLNSRAERINIGIQASSANSLLLHHPRSIISQEGLAYLVKNIDKHIWGAFTHKFDNDHYLLRFTSWYSNKIRGNKNHIFYLDHCIFANKFYLEKVGLLPKVDIFEDTLLSYKLRSLAPPILLPFIVITSAIRFKKRGVWKQALNNQLLKWKFYFGQDHIKMNKNYEKTSPLNSTYKE